MTAVADAPRTRAPRPAARPGLDPRLVVPAITALAAVVGLVGIGWKDMWIDEGATIGLVRLPFDEFLHRVLNWEVNQSPYYFVVRAWYGLGDGLATLRVVSVLFTVATIPVIYLVGRRLYDERVGMLAALLLALHGMVLQYSQMLRSYSMVVLLVTLATWSLLRAVDRPSTGRALLYAAVATLAVYTHFFAALVVGAHAATLLVLRPFPRRLVLVVGVAMALPMLRIAHYVVTARSDPISFLDRPSAFGLATRIKDLTGASPEQLLVYAPLLAAGVLLSVRAWRSARTGSREAWLPTVAPAWLVLPVVLIVVTTYAAKPLFEPKYLIVVVPAVTLVAAAGVVSLPAGRVRLAAGTALVAISIVGLIEIYGWQAPEDWDGATEMVLADVRPGDAVVVAQYPGVPVVEYHRDQAGRSDVPLVDPRPGSQPAHDRLWEISRTDLDDRTFRLPPWNPRRGYPDWRDEHYQVVDERRVTGLAIRLLERRG